MENEITSIPVGAEDLLFLPYLQGERTPNLPQARGTLHGITLKNYTSAHIARATMEGVTMGMAYGLDKLRKLGVSISEIRLTGGGSKSSIWRSICADIFGVPTVTLSNTEGAALGAAIQAIAAACPEKSRFYQKAIDKLNFKWHLLRHGNYFNAGNPAQCEGFGRKTGLG